MNKAYDYASAAECMITTIEQATGMEFDGRGSTLDGKIPTYRFYDTPSDKVLEFPISQFYGLYESCKLKLEVQA